MRSSLLLALTFSVSTPLGCSLVVPGLEDGSSTEGLEKAATIEIKTDRERYAPLDLVYVTVTNTGAATVYLDMCSGGIEGWYTAIQEWNGSYGMSRICAFFPTHEDVLEHMRPLRTGIALQDTLHINSRAYPGRWRVYYHILDSRGELIPNGRVTSPEFQVTEQ